MLKRSARPHHSLFINALGWYGVCAVICAYTLSVFGFISVHRAPYLFLNLTGAAAICVEAFTKKDFQPATLNFAWALVALVSLLMRI